MRFLPTSGPTPKLRVRYYLPDGTYKETPGRGRLKVYYRQGTTDEKSLDEVLRVKEYEALRIGMVVEAGERWLDLGANVGAFAVFCKLRGAVAHCYEPIESCFEVLTLNVAECIEKGQDFTAVRAAVTASPSRTVEMWESSSQGNYYRGTIIPKGNLKAESVVVPNVRADRVTGHYDGVKMDIEGAEFGILDNHLLRLPEKLCFEYHVSRDPSPENLRRRMEYLFDSYKEVRWGGGPKELQILCDPGLMEKRPWQDRVVYCVGLRSGG